MDNERIEVEALAGGVETADIGWVGRGGAPHAGAGGKNLQGVGADGMRDLERSRDVPGDGGMDSDAPAAILPGRNLWRGRRLRTVLVGVIEEKVYSLLFVGHS